jgi:hypothetical protein
LGSDRAQDAALNVRSKNPGRGTDYDDWEPYSEELWNLGSGPSRTSQHAVAGPSMMRRRSLDLTHIAPRTGTHSERNTTLVPAWALDRAFGGRPSTDVPDPIRNDMPAKDCMICVERKSWERFPETSPTAKCQHAPNTCLQCIEKHIKTQLESKIFHEKIIRCPECSEILDPTEVQKFADIKTFSL